LVRGLAGIFGAEIQYSFARCVPISQAVKVVLTVLVYLCLVLALALVSVFTRRPEPVEISDEDE
jgi:hypothetical protein